MRGVENPTTASLPFDYQVTYFEQIIVSKFPILLVNTNGEEITALH